MGCCRGLSCAEPAFSLTGSCRGRCEAAASETQCQADGPVVEAGPVVGVHDVHRGIFRIDSHIPEIELEHHIDGGEIAVRPLVLVLLLLIVQPVLVHN